MGSCASDEGFCERLTKVSPAKPALEMYQCVLAFIPVPEVILINTPALFQKSCQKLIY